MFLKLTWFYIIEKNLAIFYQELTLEDIDIENAIFSKSSH